MTKFVAVVKREYLERLKARMFIVTTILFPLSLAFFSVVPVLIMTVGGGASLRLVVVDETGKLHERVQSELEGKPKASAPQVTGEGTSDRFELSNFITESIVTNGASTDQVKEALDRRLDKKEIDAYLILPADIFEKRAAQLYRRNTGDPIVARKVRDAVEAAFRTQLLADAKVDAKTIDDLERSISLDTNKVTSSGNYKDSGAGFAVVFGVGFLMYISVLLYGQMTLGAVIEEKETRIAEVLFSSVRPFTLMAGKLLGVALLALTQLAIWGLAFSLFSAFGVNLLAAKGLTLNMPSIPGIFYFYFMLFFLLGYFLYSTLYALVGSIVTTPQEGGQLAMPIVIVLVVGFYFFLPVSRNPESAFAFWLSLFPLFAPVTMMVRIVTQTPPFWQILLSLFLGYLTAGFLLWVAARVYRIGMLMTGKKATLPEIWRWFRQA
jgi:ABC-2 type transport system permease protein